MKNNGGRAFPVPENMGAYGAYQINEQGMSLRDWFAGHALPSVVAAVYAGQVEHKDGLSEQRIAEQAYARADAMLAERAKP